jgi:hypothetical protein
VPPPLVELAGDARVELIRRAGKIGFRSREPVPA